MVLEHLMSQQVDPSINWEVIVVDNASTDNTAEVARRSWTRNEVSLKIFHESNPGLSNARSRGLKETSYSVVSFIDDDNWVENQWVQKVHDWFAEDDKIGLLGGRGEAVFEGERPEWFTIKQRSYAVGPQAKQTGQVNGALYGAGLTIRKIVWEHLKSSGFKFILSGRKGKSLTSGEDSELCSAVKLLGYQLFYDEDLHFYHFMPKERLNWPYLIKLSKAFGRSDPIINIYRSVLNGYRGYHKFIRENILGIVLYAIFQVIRSSPGYLRVLLFYNEGRREEALFYRNVHRMIESIRLIGSLSRYVSTIKQWSTGARIPLETKLLVEK